MLFPSLLLLFSISGTHAQFAEIASLATSLLGGGLGGLGAAGSAAAGAGSAAGALGQIGQLYQLAQGALQLTSTGVGVLNQATEGNWFPAALETAAKNGETLHKTGGGGGGLGGLGGHGLPGLGGGGGGGGLPGLGGLMGLGPLGPRPGGGGAGVGPEFGTSFPAPDVDDYNEDLDVLIPATTPKSKDPFEEVEDRDLQRPTVPTTRAATTTTEDVTLFPDEEEEEFATPAPTAPPKKQIRIELPKEEEDYLDQVTKEDGSEVEVTNREKKDGDEILLPRKVPKAVAANFQVDPKPEELKKDKKVPNLEKLLDTLRQKSSLSEEEIMELIGQVEGNGNIEQPPKIDFNSGVQNIAEKKVDHRKRIIDASRRIDANWRGQPVHGHRLTTVTIPVTQPPTPAPFVHSTAVSEDVVNNRLQREIIAAEHDKDLAQARADPKQVVNKVSPPRQGPAQPVPAPPRPSPAPTQLAPATAAPYTYPPNYGQTRPAVHVGQQQYAAQQPQAPVYQAAPQQASVQGSPLVQQAAQQPAQQTVQPYPAQTYPNQYYYQNQLQQVPASYPIQQQQYYPQYQQYQQYPWTQQQQYPYYYQQNYPQQQQQQYHTQQVQVQQQPQPQPQLQQTAPQGVAQQQPQGPQGGQQQAAPRGGQQQPAAQIGGQQRAQLNQGAAQPVQQQQAAPQGQRQVEPAHRPVANNKAVQNVNGMSNTVYTNKPGQEKFFFTPSKEAVVRGRRNQALGARIIRQESTKAPHKRFYPRTARTQPLTTPLPVGRGGTRAANPSLTKN